MLRIGYNYMVALRL